MKKRTFIGLAVATGAGLALDFWPRKTSAQSKIKPQSVTTATCVNLAPLGFWGNCDPFINRLKRASRWWHKYGVTEDRYTDLRTRQIKGLPAGEVLMNLINVQDIGGEFDFTEQRAGKHVLVWDGSLSLGVAGNSVDAGRTVYPNRFEFEIPPTIGAYYANPAMNLHVVNSTGTPQDLNNAALFHADDEADYLAGKRYQRNFINAFCGATTVRTMDWSLCPMGGVDAYGKVVVKTVEPANYYDSGCYTYFTGDNNEYFFPPEEIGYLAKEANVSIFNTMSARSSDATFAYWATEFLKGAGHWTGDLLSELGDENWNRAWPWVAGSDYLIDTVSPGIKIVDRDGKPSSNPVDAMGCATASRSLAMWYAMERVIPRTRHKRVLAGQFMAGAGKNGMGGMLAYVDPVSRKTAGKLADYYAVAPYWSGRLNGDTLTLATILQNRLWGDDAFWIDRCKKQIDSMHEPLKWNKDMLAKYAPNLRLTCYEGGGWLWEEAMPQKGNPLYDAGKEFDKFCRGFMDGEPGKVVMRYYWDTFINGNFAHYNQFQHNGYVYGVQTGLANSQVRADTPRQALFRTLGK